MMQKTPGQKNTINCRLIFPLAKTSTEQMLRMVFSVTILFARAVENIRLVPLAKIQRAFLRIKDTSWNEARPAKKDFQTRRRQGPRSGVLRHVIRFHYPFSTDLSTMHFQPLRSRRISIVAPRQNLCRRHNRKLARHEVSGSAAKDNPS